MRTAVVVLAHRSVVELVGPKGRGLKADASASALKRVSSSSSCSSFQAALKTPQASLHAQLKLAKLLNKGLEQESLLPFFYSKSLLSCVTIHALSYIHATWTEIVPLGLQNEFFTNDLPGLQLPGVLF